jgi:hypothetical protein
MRTYAAQVDTDTGLVTQVIVGTADWANQRLDGTWVDTPTLVGIGWTYTDGTFTPPAPEIDPDDDQDDEV